MELLCGCFKCVSEARHKRGVASMKFSHFEAFPYLSAGGYSTDKSTAKNSKNPQRHPPRNPQLNQQISTAKSTAEAGRRGGGVRFVPPPLWVPGRLKSIFVIPLFVTPALWGLCRPTVWAAARQELWQTLFPKCTQFRRAFGFQKFRGPSLGLRLAVLRGQPPSLKSPDFHIGFPP